MKNAKGEIGLVPTTFVYLAPLQERVQAKIQPLTYSEEVMILTELHIDDIPCMRHTFSVCQMKKLNTCSCHTISRNDYNSARSLRNCCV